MRRWLYLRILLGAAAMLPVAALAQTAAGARVQQVIVHGSGDAMEVEIQTSGAVAPETQAISGPDRIVVDFPGAIPAAELRALKINRGALKSVRSGLFFSNPPITRVVLDLTGPQSYRISTGPNGVVVKLGAAKVASTTASAPVAKLQNASLTGASQIGTHSAQISSQISSQIPVAVETSETAATEPLIQPPPKPQVTVTLENGMLRIHAEKATLAQVLFEVQRQTHAEIAIPAGAEQEEVAADLGPGTARDVLGALLNGSPYNFIFVGNELSLERVILTRRDSGVN
jgi:hypothetical protein